MTITDYEQVRELLSVTPGVILRTADSRPAIERYLARNLGLSFVARRESQLVGCVMCGHDGRRGYLQHVAVDPAYRNGGVGRRLVQHCLDVLKELGIEKVHIDVLAENQAAQEFWQHLGWSRRDDLLRYSWTSSDDPNA
jgi:ribosomal protein S18 acetylase RimI-like enzyme